MAAASPARELTQNPLQKTWEPYDNGLPAGHSAQRGGERDGGGAGCVWGVSARAALSEPRRAAAVSGTPGRPLLLLLLLGWAAAGEPGPAEPLPGTIRPLRGGGARRAA